MRVRSQPDWSVPTAHFRERSGPRILARAVRGSVDSAAVIERQDSTRQGVRARLRELVATARVGDWQPSERELSLRWGVARMTIRAAMDALVADIIAKTFDAQGGGI